MPGPIIRRDDGPQCSLVVYIISAEAHWTGRKAVGDIEDTNSHKGVWRDCNMQLRREPSKEHAMGRKQDRRFAAEETTHCPR